LWHNNVAMNEEQRRAMRRLEIPDCDARMRQLRSQPGSTPLSAAMIVLQEEIENTAAGKGILINDEVYETEDFFILVKHLIDIRRGSP